MFDSPFPSHIEFCCQHEDQPRVFPIFPEEEALLTSAAVEKRQKEFFLGRDCAHQALSAFQMGHVPILKKKNRAPIWPDSMVGSITHSRNWAAAAVAETSKVGGVGIDLEDLRRTVNLDIQRHVCREREADWLAQFSEEQQDYYLKIIFSAKESIFKCYFPISEIFLNFEDAEIVLNEEKSQFEFTLLRACGPGIEIGYRHYGTYQVADQMVLTAIWIDAFE